MSTDAIEFFSRKVAEYIDKSKFVVVEYSFDKIKYCFDLNGLGSTVVLAGNPPEIAFATGGVVDAQSLRCDRQTGLREAFALWATPQGQEYLEREMKYTPEPHWGEFFAFSNPTSDSEVELLANAGLKCDFSEHSGNVTTMPDDEFCFKLLAQLVNSRVYTKPFFLVTWFNDAAELLILMCSNEDVVSALRDSLACYEGSK